LVLGSALLTGSPAMSADCPAFLNHEFTKLHSSQKLNLCAAFAGKPLLVVNTASHCGYTRQFKGLEALHRKYRERGLVVNYGVTFTMLAPSSVTGAAANPVFKELARQSQQPGWNFNKYLVTPDGTVAKYFASSVEPDARELEQAIETLL
jgi:glutathione peroxidase